jgi:hypothetical protein
VTPPRCAALRALRPVRSAERIQASQFDVSAMCCAAAAAARPRRGRLGSVNAAAAALAACRVCVAQPPSSARPRRGGAPRTDPARAARAAPPGPPPRRPLPARQPPGPPARRPARPAPGWIRWHIGWRGVNRSTVRTRAATATDDGTGRRHGHGTRLPTARHNQATTSPPHHPHWQRRGRGPRRRGRRGATWPRSPPACPHTPAPLRVILEHILRKGEKI